MLIPVKDSQFDFAGAEQAKEQEQHGVLAGQAGE
jgi:hypothetical protein